MVKDSDPPKNNPPIDGYLRLSQIIGCKKRNIQAIIPVSKSTWWLGIKQGRYPPPKKLSPGVTVWKISHIRRLVEGND